MMHDARTKVETPAEYRKAMDAAETLGLELVDERPLGMFNSFNDNVHNGKEMHVKLEPHVELEKVGRTYFHFRMTDDTEEGEHVYKCESVNTGREFSEKGYVELRFRNVNDN